MCATQIFTKTRPSNKHPGHECVEDISVGETTLKDFVMENDVVSNTSEHVTTRSCSDALEARSMVPSCGMGEGLEQTKLTAEVPVAAELVNDQELFSYDASVEAGFIPLHSPQEETSALCRRIKDSRKDGIKNAIPQEITADLSWFSRSCNAEDLRTIMFESVGKVSLPSPDEYVADLSWSDRFQELHDFNIKHGHCLVPNNYEKNPALARWVKRQRHQYKQLREAPIGMQLNKLTKDRMRALDAIGFVWDCQASGWEDKIAELQNYRELHSNCNVPTCYPTNPGLAMWVKCQRRQYKLFASGKRSSMTLERIRRLENLGFRWEVRTHKKGCSRKSAGD